MAINKHPFGNAAKPIFQIKNGKIIKLFASISSAAREMRKVNPNANISHISDCANGKYKTAYGYEWKFAD